MSYNNTSDNEGPKAQKKTQKSKSLSLSARFRAILEHDEASFHLSDEEDVTDSDDLYSDDYDSDTSEVDSVDMKNDLFLSPLTPTFTKKRKLRPTADDDIALTNEEWDDSDPLKSPTLQRVQSKRESVSPPFLSLSSKHSKSKTTRFSIEESHHSRVESTKREGKSVIKPPKSSLQPKIQTKAINSPSPSDDSADELNSQSDQLAKKLKALREKFAATKSTESFSDSDHHSHDDEHKDDSNDDLDTPQPRRKKKLDERKQEDAKLVRLMRRLSIAEELESNDASLDSHDVEDHENYNHSIKHTKKITKKSGTQQNAKKTQSKKDPNAPKAPMNAYLLFAEAHRAKVRATMPGATAAEVAKRLAEQWRQMSAEEKEPYERKYRAAKKQYEREMAEYRAKRPLAQHNE